MGASVQKGMRAGRRGRARAAPMSEINVTPFVDVMLVLLIIFMVAAPLLTVGVPLDLPKSQAQSLPSENEPPLTVNLDAEGRVYIQKTEVPPEELIVRLAAIQAERTSDKIYLRADRSLDYGRVMQVMGALSAGGFARVALVTDQAERSDR
ncbi:protein TolR [Limibaculum sp. FT325]|uniref:protein TolR n=1 Tax=Thermohalobaculum sediminis TaxID=2939436 RepID=UPI0020BE0C82|nr:protein TolR [Limibaculum sediminis]MCL5778505.1 protein TolR [Limibaculum sediminis]